MVRGKVTAINNGGRKPGTTSTNRKKNDPETKIPPKEMRVLENRFIRKMTLADSAVEAGYRATSRESAAVMASQVVNKNTGSNGALTLALEAEGVTPERLAEIISAGLKAMKTVEVGKGEWVEQPDYLLRHKYLETALDITGARAPKRLEVKEEKTFEERLRELTLEGGTDDLPGGFLAAEDDDDGEWPG